MYGFFLCSRIFQPQHCWHFGSENHVLLGVILCKVGCLAASQATTFSGHQQRSSTVTTKNVSRRCHYWLKTTMKNWKGQWTHIIELNANVKIPHLNLTHLQLLLLPIYCQVLLTCLHEYLRSGVGLYGISDTSECSQYSSNLRAECIFFFPLNKLVSFGLFKI